MKFDSSASDGIRTIWAYTLALLQVSAEKGGNHPGVIIFDEPAQQSIVSEDMKSFIRSVVEVTAKGQIIMAITHNSKELIQIIDELDTNRCHRVQIKDRAFKQFGKKSNRTLTLFELVRAFWTEFSGMSKVSILSEVAKTVVTIASQRLPGCIFFVNTIQKIREAIGFTDFCGFLLGNWRCEPLAAAFRSKCLRPVRIAIKGD